MPIYEYVCEKCGAQSEILVKSIGEEVTCPKCGGRELKKLLSTFSARGGEGENRHSGSCCSCCPSGPSCPSARKP